MIKNKALTILLTSVFFLPSVKAQKIESGQQVCFRVDNLIGVSSDFSEGYNFKRDNFNGKHFDFVLDSESNVTALDRDESELKFSIIGSSLIGVYLGKNGEQNTETWTMDMQNKKVLFNRTRIGFPSFNGTGSYIGDLKTCTKE